MVHEVSYNHVGPTAQTNSQTSPATNWFFDEQTIQVPPYALFKTKLKYRGATIMRRHNNEN